jgi:hypothetical protein
MGCKALLGPVCGDTAHDILVDLDTEYKGELLSDPPAAKSRVPVLDFNDGRDQLWSRPPVTWLSTTAAHGVGSGNSRCPAHPDCEIDFAPSPRTILRCARQSDHRRTPSRVHSGGRVTPSPALTPIFADQREAFVQTQISSVTDSAATARAGKQSARSIVFNEDEADLCHSHVRSSRENRCGVPAITPRV